MEGDENVIFLPGEAGTTVPSSNFDAAPTQASTLLTMIQAETRGQTIPDMPASYPCSGILDFVSLCSGYIVRFVVYIPVLRS